MKIVEVLGSIYKPPECLNVSNDGGSYIAMEIDGIQITAHIHNSKLNAVIRRPGKASVSFFTSNLRRSGILEFAFTLLPDSLAEEFKMACTAANASTSETAS